MHVSFQNKKKMPDVEWDSKHGQAERSLCQISESAEQDKAV